VGENHGVIGDFALNGIAVPGCGIAEEVPVASERDSDFEFGRVNKMWSGSGEESILAVLRDLKLDSRGFVFADVCSVKNWNVQGVAPDDVVDDYVGRRLQQSVRCQVRELLFKCSRNINVIS
jgi:hypothetical protein